MDIINTCFTKILYTSFTASIIALIVLTIRMLFKKKLGVRLNYILLLFILLRFCMFIVPESPISILNIFINLPKTESTILAETQTLKDSTDNVDNHLNGTLHNTQHNYTKDEFASLQDNKLNKYKKTNKLNFINILALIWLLGFAINVLIFIYSQYCLKYKLKKCKQITDAEILDIVEDCKHNLKINKKVCIYTDTEFKSPYITGLLSPIVYVPKRILNMDKNHLNYILLHELSHYKRNDLVLNFATNIITSIHWFNPLIWYLGKILKEDIELACDFYVLNKIDKKRTIIYAQTILEVTKISVFSKHHNSLACYFSKSTSILERRITMIKNFNKNKYKFTAFAIAACLITGAVLLTNPVSADNSLTSNKIVKNISKYDVTAETKQFNNIDRLTKDLGNDILLPKYIPTNFNLSSICTNSTITRFRFANYDLNTSVDNPYMFFLYISKTNPKDELIKQDTIDSTIGVVSKETNISIEGLSGKKLYINNYFDSVDYFVYLKDNVYYTLSYKTYNDDNSIEGQLALSEVKKIMESLTSIDNVDKSQFTANNSHTHLYNMDDFDVARKTVNFNFRLPASDEINPIQEIYTFNVANDPYLKIDFDDIPVSIIQNKTPIEKYSKFIENNNVIFNDISADGYTGEWINIANTKIAKFAEEVDTNEYTKIYCWYEDDVFNQITFFDGKNNIDEEDLIKKYLNTKKYDEIKNK